MTIKSVLCSNCAHFNLRDSHLAKYGFGLCKVRSITAGHTFSAIKPHECEHFEQASAETVKRREQALEGIR